MHLGQTLITGGAGFIGSHLAQKILSSCFNGPLRILDNLSSGTLENLSNCINDPHLEFIGSNLKDIEKVKYALQGVNSVFHMAAYPEVRTGFDKPWISYEENIANTFLLLEEIRKSGTEQIIFASSSTVYGEPTTIPTPERYGPLLPISPYGASKLACEAMVSSYCHTYGIGGKVFRLANVIGSRSRHGVIWDFLNKMRSNNKELRILGDGRQSKSYIHISDCIDCIISVIYNTDKRLDVFNVGNDDKTDVLSIAKAACNAMSLDNVELFPEVQNSDGIGWNGDVKTMQLDISKLKQIGWCPSMSSLKAVNLACEELAKELGYVEVR